MQLTRRDLLKLGAFGSAAILLPAERVARTELAIANRVAESRLPKPFTVAFAVPPTLKPVRSSATTDFYDLVQRQVSAQIIPGLPPTLVWGYNGYVPGPTIEATKGRPIVVRQANRLPDLHPTLRYKPWTSTHLHGSASLPQFDGYASDITNPGEFKDYQYPNIQEARTLWYHDHGVHITAPNAYMGLAAMYKLHDELELSLPIPHGLPYEVPLILKDALFESNGQLIFDDNSESGLFGDVILVNGVPWPYMTVEPRKYRFRILNASISRSYGLALSTGEPLIVIATDAGLMATPQKAPVLKMGMAERYEVIIDFAGHSGQQIVLRNISPDNNEDFTNTNVVMAFRVGDKVTDGANNTIPAVLNPNDPTMALRPAQALRTRTFAFKRDSGQWTINGKTWEDVINSDFALLAAHPNLGDIEIWRFVNDSGGWFHPVHVHLVDVQILDRNGRPPFAYERGPKDVVYLGEGESVRVITQFGPQIGRYMMHCHNLVHEDHDMMVQFEVGTGGFDPITTAPAKPLDQATPL